MSGAFPGASARRRRRRRLRALALFAAVLAAAGGGWIGGYWLFENAEVPDVRQLEEFRPSIITRIFGRSGEVIGEFAQERRIVVAYDEFPEHLRQAIIAVEDADFYRHHGINVSGIARAAVRNFQAGRVVEGGSSLTQQLAKILFLTPEKSLRRKAKEALVALHIERVYSKEEILTFYLNQVYLGHNRYGVEAASLFYFGKHARDLALEEAALLAGLPKAPSDYSPHRRPEAARQRRNHVLDRMAAEGFLPPAEAEAAKAAPIRLVEIEPEDARTIGPYFVEEVRQLLERNYGERRLYHDGLNVWTTLDVSMQQAAEEALRAGLLALDKRQGWRGPIDNVLARAADTDLESYADPSWERPIREGDLVRGLVVSRERERLGVRVGPRLGTLTRAPAWTRRSNPSELLRPGDLATFRVTSLDPREPRLGLELEQEPLVEGALVALDVKTGEVLALVGGWDFRRSKFDRAVQAWRQTGSSFKPILYAAALASGFTAADSLFDEPIAIPDPWTGKLYSPENYTQSYYGLTTLREALEKSRNPISVQLLEKVGAPSVIALAKKLGLTARLEPYPSLALGVFEETLLEMTSAFSAFADLGVVREPHFVRRITDRDGTVLLRKNPAPRQALAPDVAYLTNYIMQGVVQYGTATEARKIGRPLAGKTGTTDDFTDAWFIGFSPSLIAGVWVGFDVKQSLGKGEVGARAALPIWIDFMTAALAGAPDDEFARPPSIEFATIDKDTGLRASEACTTTFPEAFVRGTAPVAVCTPRDHDVRALPYYLQKTYLGGAPLPPPAALPAAASGRPEAEDHD